MWRQKKGRGHTRGVYGKPRIERIVCFVFDSKQATCDHFRAVNANAASFGQIGANIGADMDYFVHNM